MDELVSFCKKTGFVFPSGEIYGGLAGFWDYGPYGVEVKRAIKNSWWETFVRGREDVYGIDGTTITHPKIWEASGHTESFSDPLVDCRKCKERVRADHLVEDELKIAADGLSLEKLAKIIDEKGLKCPKCGGELTEARQFNLMFKTHIGPIEDETSVAYLRPETAQLIFADFKLVAECMRAKLPFGIAQIGKGYRNEISPRNFVFRCREFEMMELEYFIDEDELHNCPWVDEISGIEVQFYSAEMQEKKKETEWMTFGEALEKKIIKTGWHAYWLAKQYEWCVGLGLGKKNLRLRQHLPDERSHYALDTWDIDYNFDFGWKEIHGMANRTTFDLSQHEKFSGEKLRLFNQEKKEHVLPYVAAEPSWGVGRLFLALMSEAFQKQEDGDVVLRLDRRVAPVKVAVFPLVRKEQFKEKAREIVKSLGKFGCQYDESGSIGRRYRRQDQIGTPLCITVDKQTLEDETVTVRERDSREQRRVKIDDLEEKITLFLDSRVDFEGF